MLIHDIKPVKQVKHLSFGIPKVRQEAVARELEETVLITELWQRGISIKDVFSAYYALEEEGAGRSPLTVGDAELAGLASVPTTPLNRQPF